MLDSAVGTTDKKPFLTKQENAWAWVSMNGGSHTLMNRMKTVMNGLQASAPQFGLRQGALQTTKLSWPLEDLQMGAAAVTPDWLF